MLTILAVLAGAAFLAAPWFALRALQAAARDGDLHALSELVDYPAVRAGLRAEQVGPARPIWSDPVGAVRRAIDAQRRAPAGAERHLTPQGLSALAGPPRLVAPARYWGLNRVRFETRAATGPAILTFQRQGVYRWRLVGLTPPQVSAGFRGEAVAGP